MKDGGCTRREFLKLSLVAAASPALLAACATRKKERVVNFFNWSSYIAKDTLPRFTRETAIKVNYEVYADEEEMFSKLRAGAPGYDLAVGTDYMIPRMKDFNMIDPIPPGILANAGNIDPLFRDTPYDPDNAYTVPYLWGTTGIGYNKSKLAAPPTSWRDLWDEKFSGKISMLDNARDCISMGLSLLGYPETTGEEKAFREVREMFIKQRPLVKRYSSANYVDALISGEVLLAMAWSGDVLQASRENPQLDYVIPREGSYIWADDLCLVRGSEHREDSLRLIDYLLRPDTAAEIANSVRFASPNLAARPLLDNALLADPRVFPPRELASRLKFHAVLDPAATQLWNETWSDIKAV